jgi:hypothetical protein
MLELPDYVVAVNDVCGGRYLCRGCVAGDAGVRAQLVAGDGSAVECEVWNVDLEVGEAFVCDGCGRVIVEGGEL